MIKAVTGKLRTGRLRRAVVRRIFLSVIFLSKILTTSVELSLSVSIGVHRWLTLYFGHFPAIEQETTERTEIQASPLFSPFAPVPIQSPALRFSASGWVYPQISQVSAD
jgi:hypothetical protein